MGLPIVQEQPGDCYRWGTNWCTTLGLGGSPSTVKLSPESILGINHLDVMEVAVGFGHAALLTRNGEMYTWGEGKHGKLGSGHQEHIDAPEKLHTLWGQPVRHICASGKNSYNILSSSLSHQCFMECFLLSEPS